MLVSVLIGAVLAIPAAGIARILLREFVPAVRRAGSGPAEQPPAGERPG
ncbi:hypothetical protein AB0F73_01860 [Micromonospora purpureochromogenes]